MKASITVKQIAPRTAIDLCLDLARNGDTTATFRQSLIDQQTRQCMEGARLETKSTIQENRLRGLPSPFGDDNDR